MTRPKIQVAFDVTTVGAARGVLESIASEIDIIEAGTVLCLSEGLGAVADLRAAYPTHSLVADIRIARAGRKFADMAFSKGADLVTVIGESPHDVVAGAIASAESFGGCVEVELGPEWSGDDIVRWRDLGVANLIVHRPLGVPASEDHATLAALRKLAEHDLGAMDVTLAGGLSVDALPHFAEFAIDTFVIGNAIVEASDPAAAVRDLRAAIDESAEVRP